MENKRVIFYYQTFKGLSEILVPNTPVTHIHVSSIHFGTENDGQPYIHLNNNYPTAPVFNQVWNDLEKASSLGIKIVLMIGGAGGGYTSLFDENYNTNCSLLFDLIGKYPIIDGIDLDVEQYVTLADIKKFMNDFKSAFPKLFITMAPVSASLESDTPGMGGFIYKDLYNSPEGKYVEYFNGQFYYDYSVQSYEKAINNGYPPDKIVFGVLAGCDSDQIAQILHELSSKYPDFGGVFAWEYFMMQPTPGKWAQNMRQSMNGNNRLNSIWSNLTKTILNLF